MPCQDPAAPGLGGLSVFCPQCGTIIGRDAPPDLYKCPRCTNVIKVQAFAVEDEVTVPRFISFDGSRKRLVGLYVSEAMIRFLLSNRSERAEEWEPLLSELEEEQLKAFARRMGWIISRVLRDPGPRVAEQERPFGGIEQDLKEGLINTVLVTDFERVPRRDLFRLHELTQAHDAVLVSIAPHQADDNLLHENIDYDTVPLSHADNAHVERHLDPEQLETAISKAMERFGWLWTYYISDMLGTRLGVEAIRAWRQQDPACQERHWKEVLTYYCIARARRSGLVRQLPLPQLLSCATCRRRFLDSALPLHLAELSRWEAVYCRSCLAQAFFYEDELYPLFVGPAPVDSVRDFEEVVASIQELPRERFGAIVRSVNERVQHEREENPSALETSSNLWLEVLAEQGALETWGPVTRADNFFKSADGHLHGSYGAALIDNYLNSGEIAHRLDVKYPRNIQLNPANTMRADCLVQDCYVEFLGLRGRDEFHKKIELRVELARRNRLPIVGIYAEDLLSPGVRERKLKPLAERAQVQEDDDGTGS